MSPDELAALREVDALTPGSPPLAPPPSMPAWKALGATLDERTLMLHFPGCHPISLATWELRGAFALKLAP